jgi:hypothetical protein
MIKFEFPADRTDIAAAIGRALLEIGAPDSYVSKAEAKAYAEDRLEKLAESDAEELADLQDSNEMPDSSHIEAKIPASQGGTMLGASIQPGDEVSFETNSGEVITGTAADNGTLPQVDGKGVAFHAAFCGISAKPFYETGKTSGQWKKRRNVDQAAYDAWYAEQLANDSCESDTPVDTAPVDTAGAFGATDAQHTDPFHTHAPTTCGDFMGWASAKQAAELLTQADITEAYATAGLVITDLFPPNDDAVIAERVAVLYAALSPLAHI